MKIGYGMKTPYIIADTAFNHEGDIKYLCKMIDEIDELQLNAIKFHFGMKRRQIQIYLRDPDIEIIASDNQRQKPGKQNIQTACQQFSSDNNFITGCQNSINQTRTGGNVI